MTFEQVAIHLRCLLLWFSTNILKSVLSRFDALLQKNSKTTTLKNKSVIQALKRKNKKQKNKKGSRGETPAQSPTRSSRTYCA